MELVSVRKQHNRSRFALPLRAQPVECLLLLFSIQNVMTVASKGALITLRRRTLSRPPCQSPVITEKGEVMARQTLTARDLGKTRGRRVLAVIAALGATALVLPALA